MRDGKNFSGAAPAMKTEGATTMSESRGWSIAERFVLGKSAAPETCEDVVVATQRFVGVIDSYSGFAPCDGPQTFGRRIALATLAAFRQARPQADIEAIVADASARVRALKEDAGLALARTGGCFFCVVDVAADAIYRVGDCWFAIDGIANRVVLAAEQPLTALRAAYLHACLLGGASVAALMRDAPDVQLLLEYRRMKDHFANRADTACGYGVINGGDVPAAYIERHAIPSSAAAVAIGSDGYPIAGASLEVVERELQRLLAQDPLMIGESPAPKGLVDGNVSFDDRCFVRVERALSDT